PYRILSGYDAVVHWLNRCRGERCALQLKTIARHISWQPGHVRIDDFQAGRAIITLPLGVLQSRNVRFDPELPQKFAAAQQLAMGQVIKVILCFYSRFWEKRGIRNLGFLHARGEKFPTWWTTLPLETPVLVGWAAGSTAEALAARDSNDLLDIALDSLARALTTSPMSLRRRL